MSNLLKINRILDGATPGEFNPDQVGVSTNEPGTSFTSAIVIQGTDGDDIYGALSQSPDSGNEANAGTTSVTSEYHIESRVVHAASASSFTHPRPQQSLDTPLQTGMGSEQNSSGSLGGGYRILSETQNFTVADMNTLAGQLTDGFWEFNGGSYRSFNISAGGTISVDIGALTTEGQTLAHWALDAWTAVSGINFSYTSGSANITFDDSVSGAYSSSTTDLNHHIVSSIVNISTDWIDYYGYTMDTYSLQTYIHEIGHAIGLGHAGDYNGSATYGVDNKFTFDSWQTSVMSYFSQQDNTDLNADYAYLLTPMVADVIAIRNLYGTVTIHGSDDTYAYDDSAFTSSVARTIVETGGNDTLDYSAFSSAQVLDLRDGYYSDVEGLRGNLGISVGTIIENAYSGSGDDTLIGNSANNHFRGGAGIDTVVFTGAHTNYSATYDSGTNTFTLVDLTGADGTDTLFDVEKVRFSDGIRDLSHPPTVANPISDQAADQDEAFNFTFAANTFNDIDAGDVLTYSATKGDGSALPAWLSFNAATRTFSGTPAAAILVPSR